MLEAEFSVVVLVVGVGCGEVGFDFGGLWDRRGCLGRSRRRGGGPFRRGWLLVGEIGLVREIW